MFVHIYKDMDNIGLKIVGEGAISTKEMTDKIFAELKSIIQMFSKAIKDMRISEEQLPVLIDEINGYIKRRVFDTGMSPCPIKFDKTNNANGVYSKIKKEIRISWNYLIQPHITGFYKIKDMRTMKLNDMYNTLEHELIHQQQDERSKSKFLRDKIINYIGKKYIDKSGETSISDLIDIIFRNERLYQIYKKANLKFFKKEYSELISRKQFIDPYISDEKFISNVEYYNNQGELNTFAKEAVNNYIKNKLMNLKTDITYDSRRGAVTKNVFDSKEVRALILPFVDFDTEKYNDIDKKFFDSTILNNKYNFRNKLISYYDGYEYLTKENKKQWWKYVFQLLMNVKFDPIIKKN